jgi:cell division topological specificity factor
MAFFDLFLDYFRRSPKPAALAKERLSVIVARERASTRGGPDYLPQLQQELLAVLAKYETIDLENVTVKLDRSGDYEVLELNIILPDQLAPKKDEVTGENKGEQKGAPKAPPPGKALAAT